MWDPVVICTVAPIRDPYGPCGSSGLLVYGTHMGSPRFIPCWLLVYGTHVGSPRFNPCGLLVYGTHMGSPRFIPCGLLVYGTHVGSPRFNPCGLLVYGTNVGSPTFIPFRLLVYGTHVGSPSFILCGLLVHGAHVGCQDDSHLGTWVAYGARLAQVGPSRHLHRGIHLGRMLVKVVLTYFRYSPDCFLLKFNYYIALISTGCYTII